jgi:nucleoside-diphosphate-sugar epimerase
LNKTLLLIGGTGFFGKSIIDYLSNSSFFKRKIKKVIILSRGSKKIKINKFQKKKFNLIKINKNILTAKKIPSADYVIYCTILKDLKKDSLAFNNYFNLAKKYHSNSRILYISSGSVYGQQPKNVKKIKENYLFFNDRINFNNKLKEIHSLQKLKNEEKCHELARFGIKISIARCFTFSGKYLPLKKAYAVGSYALGDFISNILKNKNIKVRSPHEVIRSYMHSEDLARWLMKILFNSNTKCPVFNVGSDKQISISKLANILAKKFKKKVIFRQSNKKINYVDRYIPDINKAKLKLKLNIKYSNLKGIFKAIKELR